MPVNPSHIKEHMEVVGTDGRHVGAVDKVEGDRIKLTKSDPASGGEHRYIGVHEVERVDEHVHVSTSGAKAPTSD